MRGKPVLLRDAAEQWIKEGKTGDFQHWTGAAAQNSAGSLPSVPASPC